MRGYHYQFVRLHWTLDQAYMSPGKLFLWSVLSLHVVWHYQNNVINLQLHRYIDI